MPPAEGDRGRFDFYLLLCYHILKFERGLAMTSKPQGEAVTVGFFLSKKSLSVPNYGSGYYFTYFYAYAKASGKLPHAQRIPHP
jgi:hypothetical protein